MPPKRSSRGSTSRGRNARKSSLADLEALADDTGFEGFGARLNDGGGGGDPPGRRGLPAAAATDLRGAPEETTEGGGRDADDTPTGMEVDVPGMRVTRVQSRIPVIPAQANEEGGRQDGPHGNGTRRHNTRQSSRGDGDGRNQNGTVRKQRKTAAGRTKGGGDGNPSSHLVNSNPAAARTLEMAYYECRVDPYRGLGVTEEGGGNAAMEEAEGNESVATQPEEGSDADSDAALPDTGAAPEDAGAASQTSAEPRPARRSRRPPASEGEEALVGMGYGRDRARAALERSGGDPSAAVDWLCGRDGGGGVAGGGGGDPAGGGSGGAGDGSEADGPSYRPALGGIAVPGSSPWLPCRSVLRSHCASCRTVGGTEGAVDRALREGQVVSLDDGEGEEDGRGRGVHAVLTGCPTVDAWTLGRWDAHCKLVKKQKGRKKKRGAKRRKRSDPPDDDENNDGEDEDGGEAEARLILGARGEGEVEARHPCDYNPHCLASLGGVVDGYMKCAARVRLEDRLERRGGDDRMEETEREDDVAGRIRAYLEEETRGGTEAAQSATGEGLRAATEVDADDVRSHLVRFVLDGEGEDADGLVRAIQSRHARLVFRQDGRSPPPVRDGGPPSLFDGDDVVLSAPPGLRNLGATCYLNSQLQCLAHNPGFVSGLLAGGGRVTGIVDDSGTDADAADAAGADRMDLVIGRMRDVLGGMAAGPDRVVCTSGFARALNLEEDEMQDPNEFSRLLFDRMSESFARGAARRGGEGDGGRLEGLLPSLFGGTLRYATRCLECGFESVRGEDFSDLSVPIAGLREAGGEGGGGTCGRKRKKGPARSAAADVDVQRCLDSYLQPEALAGDCQYHCSNCNKKCDAVREMVCSRNPPIFNIQLARYVFDKETFSKRKLSDRVLLPRTLLLPSLGSDVTYVLCAVQNHLGTTPHGGHYVAEVMDWTTGAWWECNDESVTRMPDGPSSSYDPDGDGGDGDGGAGVKGSSDAYNLFYVERGYLARQVRASLEGDAASLYGGVLADIDSRRDERYEAERDSRRKSTEVARRTDYRRRAIVDRVLLPGLLDHSPGGERVWVDGTFLRRVLSCSDGLGDLFEDTRRTGAPLQPRSLHESPDLDGVDPRVARRGKAVPVAAYRELDEVLRGEYRMYLQDGGELYPDAIVAITDAPFRIGTDVVSSARGDDYRREMGRKLGLLEALAAVNDDLREGNEPDRTASPGDGGASYVVARSWATDFKKYVKRKLTELQRQPPKKSGGTMPLMAAGGIDFLDLSEICPGGVAPSGEGKPAGKPAFDPADSTPTSKITCEHGKCPMMHDRKVRLVSSDTWGRIANLYPDAVAHKYSPKEEGRTGNCELCFAERNAMTLFPKKMETWVQKVGDCDDLVDILGRSDRRYPVGLGESPGRGDASEAEDELVIVHHLDVQRWRDVHQAVGAFVTSKRKPESLRKELIGLLFEPSSADGGSLRWKFRSLKSRHGELLGNSKFLGLAPFSQEQGPKSFLESLAESNVELLSKSEFKRMKRTLTALDRFIHGTENVPWSEDDPSVLVVLEGTTSKFQLPQMSGDLDDLVVFGDERIEDGVLLPKATANKKPSEKKPPKPEGPICRVVVHEIEDEECFDVEVAASQIALDLESNDSSETVQTTSTGRPRRTRSAATGKGPGGFPVREYELALDANLSHLRLLIHQGNSKPLFNQRLFLLPASAGLDAVELDRGAANSKTMYETATGITCNPEMDVHSYHTLRLILVHGNSDDGAKKGRRRAKMTDEEKSLEQAMMATLMETACLGWKDSSNAKKKKKPRRQERGFQGTFLQSSAPLNGSNSSSDTDDVEVVERNETGSSTDAMANQNAPADVVILNGDTPAEDSNVQGSEIAALVRERVSSRLALLQGEAREARVRAENASIKMKGVEASFDSICQGVIDALNAEGPQAGPDDDLVDGLIDQHISS